MPLAGTQNWRRYVTIATQCSLSLVLLVQAFHKGGSSSELHEEVEGVEDATEEDMETTQGLSEGEAEDVMVGAGGEGADGPREPMGEVDEEEPGNTSLRYWSSFRGRMKSTNVLWTRTRQMMRMVRRCQRTGERMSSHSLV